MPRLIACVLTLAGICTSQVTLAAETPLDAIPKNAGLVVRLKSPKATYERVQAFAKEADPFLGAMVPPFDRVAGILIDNPTLRGVDVEADWWMAAFFSPDERPQTAFIIPADDADALQESVGPNFHFATHEGWVIYSLSPDAIDIFPGGEEASEENIAGAVPEKAQAVFDGGDLSMFINVPVLRETYREAIEAGREQLAQLSDNMAENAPEQVRGQLTASFAMYEKLADMLLQLISDAEGGAVGIQVQNRALSSEHYIAVGPDTDSAKMLAEHKPSNLDLMKKLPANAMAYLGMHGGLEELTQWSMGYSAEILGSDPEEFNEIAEKFKELKFGQITTAVFFEPPQEDEGAFRAVSFTEVEPSNKLREMSQEMMKKMQDAPSFSGVKLGFEFEADAEEYGERKADVTTTTIETEEGTGNPSAAFIEAFYGKEGIVQRLVTLDGMLVQTSGGGREQMEQALAALDGKTKAADLFTAEGVRGELLDEANLIGLVDLPRAAVGIVSALGSTGRVPVPAEQLQAVKLDPAYAGVSARAEAEGLRAKTFLPVQVIQNAGRLIRAAASQPAEVPEQPVPEE